ncbi:MAG: RapZ C-terminal domain-containing protein [Candidatus Dormibacteria bacterium]
MSLVVLACEERFREVLEAQVEEGGYLLLDPAAAPAEPHGGAEFPPQPDTAVVVSELAGQSWVHNFDSHDVRYWLVNVGTPAHPDYRPPARQPHRRLLGVGPNDRAYLTQLLDDWRDREVVRVDCFTFGYRDGLPAEADWVLDTRFLDSPYWVPEMRDLPGSDPRVRALLLAQPGARELIDSFLPMLMNLLPLYRSQRRSVLRLAVGCTGGKHRSVAMASELVDRINETGLAQARKLDRPPLHVPQLPD